MTTTQVSGQFDAFGEAYQHWERLRSPIVYRRLVALAPGPWGRVLYVGCGAGSVAFLLAERASDVIGVDLSPGLLSLAEDRRRRECVGNVTFENVAFANADAASLPFRAGAFDLIFSYGVFHHLDADRVLPQVGRLLVVGGRGIVFDYVTSDPRLNASPLWQIIQAFKSAPGYWRRYGWRAAWRIVAFRVSGRWLRHVCQDHFLTAEQFRETFRTHFHRCHFERYGGLMAAVGERLADKAVLA
ncbi:MAG TPA: class I SAM-dependent methyltransferase [Chloroflexi bacterium]|nr:class I SAM-dependent methyltransferase [Chloroflexota bacterium]